MYGYIYFLYLNLMAKMRKIMTHSFDSLNRDFIILLLQQPKRDNFSQGHVADLIYFCSFDNYQSWKSVSGVFPQISWEWMVFRNFNAGNFLIAGEYSLGGKFLNIPGTKFPAPSDRLTSEWIEWIGVGQLTRAVKIWLMVRRLWVRGRGGLIED